LTRRVFDGFGLLRLSAESLLPRVVSRAWLAALVLLTAFLVLVLIGHFNSSCYAIS